MVIIRRFLQNPAMISHPLARPIFPLLLLGIALSVTADTTRIVGDFSSGDLSGWQEKEFSGKTAYRLDNMGGRTALTAISDGTASGLYRKIDVDLTATPYLNWSWRIEGTLDNVDETMRGGDDYPARVYVIFSTGWFFWQTRTLNYVWSSSQPPGASWPNAFTSNATMLAVQSGDEQAGVWVSNKRNVRDDIRRYMNLGVSRIEAIALMTDTDNSGQSAKTWYGNIWFSAE